MGSLFNQDTKYPPDGMRRASVGTSWSSRLQLIVEMAWTRVTLAETVQSLDLGSYLDRFLGT